MLILCKQKTLANKTKQKVNKFTFLLQNSKPREIDIKEKTLKKCAISISSQTYYII